MRTGFRTCSTILGSWLVLFCTTQAWAAKPNSTPTIATSPRKIVRPTAHCQGTRPTATVASGALFETAIWYEIEVVDVPKSKKELQHIIESLGGSLRASHGEEFEGVVPIERVDQLLEQTDARWPHSHHNLQARDISDQIVALQIQKQHEEQSIARLEQFRKNFKKPADQLSLTQAISQSQSRILQIDSELRVLEGKTKRADIHVTFTQAQTITHEVAKPKEELPFPWLNRLDLQHLTDPHSHKNHPDYERAGRLREAINGSMNLFFKAPGDRHKLNGLGGTAAVGWSFRLVGDTSPFGIAGGVDVELGGASGSRGLAFQHNLRWLLGPGLSISKYVYMGLIGGIGSNAISNRYVPATMEIPIEYFVGVTFIPHVRPVFWARSSWIFFSEARQNGSPINPIADETALGARFTIGSQKGKREVIGFNIGVGYHEVLGSNVWMFDFGFGASTSRIRSY
jgi:hypothetical protein